MYPFQQPLPKSREVLEKRTLKLWSFIYYHKQREPKVMYICLGEENEIICKEHYWLSANGVAICFFSPSL